MDARHYPLETSLMFARRVKSYLDQFSAVYGTLPAETVNSFIANMQGADDAQTLNADAVTGELFSSFELKTVLPVFGSSALIAMGWMMVLPPYPMPPLSETLSTLAKSYVGDEAWYLWAAEPVLVPAAFAFLGAYFFSLQMLIKQFTRRDLGPNAYNAVSMRIILATLGVWVAAQWFHLADKVPTGHGTIFILSFAVGAFPLIIWQLVANVLKRLPGAFLALPNLAGTQPLSRVDGLSVWHEARLDEEDIENVPNLATADIVELMLNTKIAPNRIIDWIDQSMLLMVPPPAPKEGAQNWIGTVLRNNGIRTASALVAATQMRQGQAATIVECFPEDVRTQVISLAAAVQICPNYPMIQNWLSTEPCFPPDQEQKTALGDGAPPGSYQSCARPPVLCSMTICRCPAQCRNRPHRHQSLHLRPVSSDNRALLGLRAYKRDNAPTTSAAPVARLVRPPQGRVFSTSTSRASAPTHIPSANEKQNHQHPAAAEAKEAMLVVVLRAGRVALRPRHGELPAGRAEVERGPRRRDRRGGTKRGGSPVPIVLILRKRILPGPRRGGQQPARP